MPGPIEKAIHDKLKAHFSPLRLEVINESRNHSVPQGSESHFKVVMAAEHFDGKNLVARHRMVYDLLKEELQSGVHALSLQLFSSDEETKAMKSPPCMGGSKKTS